MATIQELLFQADNAQLRMPEFQRGWVWKRKNVRELFSSLYHGYPIGSIIVWPMKADDGRLVDSVIDGQQRLSALYSVIRGSKPHWSKGYDENAFANLMFGLEEERFDFATKERLDDPLWISVTEICQNPERWFEQLPEMSLEASTQAVYTHRITRLTNLWSKEVFVSRLPDKTSVEDAYRVFDVVNRAGTKVSEGDLVLGQISLKWHGAREVIEKRRGQWAENGFVVPLEWLLHAMAADLGNCIEYTKLISAGRDEIESSYHKVVGAAEELQNSLRDHLGLGRDQATKFNMGLIAVAIARMRMGNGLSVEADRQYLAWWLLGTLWLRWSADTRNRVNCDLDIVLGGQGVEALIQELRRKSEGLSLRPDHFAARQSASQNVLKLMRIMTRRCGARSLGNGLGLSFEHIGHLSDLQAHHVFPRALLRERSVPKKEIDEVANLAFIRHDDNLKIGAKAPADYLPEIEEKNPGVLKSQWIPEDRKLWRADRYSAFLVARRKLLAASANDFLSSLLGRDLTSVS